MQDLIGKVSWERELEDLRARGLLRTMPETEGLPGREIYVNGRSAINFSGNNYLGLAGHPALIEASREYAERWGSGSTASRLIAGNTPAHRELEEFLARWKDTRAALLFGSGYQANVGVLSSVTGENDLIISDELNHASIIDGCRLSRSAVRVYSHRDLDQLEDLLKSTGFERRLVVTESVFSMDGDRAPLKEIFELCRRWGAMLMVDEAHASGVLGPRGRGLAAAEGIVPDIQMGTLGKAMGAAGAYVAGDGALIDLLVNKARSLIFTTAAPPAVIGSALAALRIAASDEGDRRRAALAENVSRFRELMKQATGRDADPGHIVPIMIGGSQRTMRISRSCLEAGIFAHGVRFPTVPEGSARLRFTLMSIHTRDDLEAAARVLERVLDARGAGRE
jgi:8-amino-7-oxononanoate synthase